MFSKRTLIVVGVGLALVFYLKRRADAAATQKAVGRALVPPTESESVANLIQAFRNGGVAEVVMVPETPRVAQAYQLGFEVYKQNLKAGNGYVFAKLGDAEIANILRRNGVL